MKAAFKKDDELLAEIGAADGGDEHFHLWWLGQSGFLLKWQGQHLLFDPYLSDSLTAKYADTDKPHVRITERVVDPARLDFVNVATSSHNHTDHLDAETLHALNAAHPNFQLVLPAANLSFAADRLHHELGIDMIGLSEEEPITIDGFTFDGFAAAHNEIERDEWGRPRFMSFTVKFGPWTVYHSGDTLWHDRLVEELLGQDIDLALLPINGNEPERRVAGNLNGTEAAALARAVGARMAIPHHFDMFEFNTAEPGEFVSACRRLGQAHRVLQNGEGWCSSEI